MSGEHMRNDKGLVPDTPPEWTSGHSILSPSKGAMILRCAASLAAGKGVPNPPSEYAAEGTAYHHLAAEALECGTDCGAYVGITLHVQKDGSVRTDKTSETEFSFPIEPENAAHAQVYVDAVRKIPGYQYYEVRLDTSDITGVPGQGGTGDAVVLDHENDTLHVSDLKFGRGEVVFAEQNEQLIQYGAAALRKFALSHDWKFLKVAIHQPRINHYSEHTYTAEEIEAWVVENRPRFRRAFNLYAHPDKITADDYVPGEKQCRWCPIRGSCAARSQSFMDQFPVEQTEAVQRTQLLTDIELAAARDRVDAIEQWCADIKAEAHTRGVLLGKHLPGWKVVIGRAGNRKWEESKTGAIEPWLVEVLGDAAHKRTLITPADAEKKLKKHPEMWAELQTAIVQAEGSKSLVRDDSPKQAVVSNQVEFPVQAPV